VRPQIAFYDKETELSRKTQRVRMRYGTEAAEDRCSPTRKREVRAAQRQLQHINAAEILLISQRYLRSRSAKFDLRTHSFNFCLLLFQSCGERFHFFLLLRYR
jgi:hypothetical protein